MWVLFYEKLNTNCVSRNVLLNDKNIVKKKKNVMNAIILTRIQVKNQLLNLLLKTIL